MIFLTDTWRSGSNYTLIIHKRSIIFRTSQWLYANMKWMSYDEIYLPWHSMNFLQSIFWKEHEFSCTLNDTSIFQFHNWNIIYSDSKIQCSTCFQDRGCPAATLRVWPWTHERTPLELCGDSLEEHSQILSESNLMQAS